MNDSLCISKNLGCIEANIRVTVCSSHMVFPFCNRLHHGQSRIFRGSCSSHTDRSDVKKDPIVARLRVIGAECSSCECLSHQIEHQDFRKRHRVRIVAIPAAPLFRRYNLETFCTSHGQTSECFVVMIKLRCHEHDDTKLFNIVVVGFLFDKAVGHWSPSRRREDVFKRKRRKGCLKG